MTIFWTLTAVMTLAAIAAIVPALLKKHRAAGLNRDRQNVVISRERLADLERERESGGLSEAAYGQARGELERALAEDLGAETAAAPTSGGSGRWAFPVVFGLVPLLAFGIYWQLGSPEHVAVAGAGAGRAASSATPHERPSGDIPSVEELTATLLQKLEEDPSRPEGWYLLGRTYMSMQRYPEAVGAFEKLRELAGDQPGVLIALADALAMTQGARMTGRPAELVQQALAREPDNTTGLWLAGKAEAEAGNYAEAIGYYRRVEAQSLSNPQALAEIRSQIAAARQKGGIADEQMSAAPAPAAGAAITVQVSLSAEIAARAAPEDTVFVYARAVEGPPMPLAVARHQVRELPLTVTLTDEMAMMAQMKMSNFPEVRISARVSKTGNAITQPGDLVSEDAHVAVAGAEPLTLVIDRVKQ